MTHDEHTTNRPTPGGSAFQETVMSNHITAVEVVRDSDGYWIHPDLPDFDEDAGAYNEWLKSQSLETSFVWLESERDDLPAFISYFKNEDLNISAWEPTPPDGDGWFLICISDTDDGPAACYARRIDLPAIIASVPRPEPVAWIIDWPDEPELGHYLAERPSRAGRSRQLYAEPVAAQPAVPGGWMLAPVEPSIAACIIGSNAAGGAIDGRQCAVVYRAMLAAAPEAPQVAVQDRRAEACLTAMDHISTETLESFNRVGIKFDATRGYAEELEAEIATLREQNAALVAALEGVLRWIDHWAQTGPGMDFERVEAAADAALACAKGGAA